MGLACRHLLHLASERQALELPAWAHQVLERLALGHQVLQLLEPQAFWQPLPESAQTVPLLAPGLVSARLASQLQVLVHLVLQRLALQHLVSVRLAWQLQVLVHLVLLQPSLAQPLLAQP